MDKLFLTLSVVCCSTTFCLACSCPPKLSADDYCSYDIIFQGTTLAEYKQRDKPFDPKHPLFADIYADWVYTVHVDKIFWAKDDFKDLSTVSVSTPVQDSLCGTRLALDVIYVLYVWFYQGKFRTGICEQNAPWDYVSEADKQFISNLIPGYCEKQNIKNCTVTKP